MVPGVDAEVDTPALFPVIGAIVLCDICAGTVEEGILPGKTASP